MPANTPSRINPNAETQFINTSYSFPRALNSRSSSNIMRSQRALTDAHKALVRFDISFHLFAVLLPLLFNHLNYPEIKRVEDDACHRFILDIEVSSQVVEPFNLRRKMLRLARSVVSDNGANLRGDLPFDSVIISSWFVGSGRLCVCCVVASFAPELFGLSALCNDCAPSTEQYGSGKVLSFPLRVPLYVHTHNSAQ